MIRHKEKETHLKVNPIGVLGLPLTVHHPRAKIIIRPQKTRTGPSALERKCAMIRVPAIKRG